MGSVQSNVGRGVFGNVLSFTYRWQDNANTTAFGKDGRRAAPSAHPTPPGVDELLDEALKEIASLKESRPTDGDGTVPEKRK